MLRVNHLAGFGGRASATVAASGIQVVGYAAGKSQNGANVTVPLNSLVGGIGTQALEDDYVLVFAVNGGSGLFGTLSALTSGFEPLNAQVGVADSVITTARPFAKRMTSSPDTSVEVQFQGAATTSSCVVIVIVLRGVDESTPMDVALQPVEQQNTALLDPASITPSTAGALVVIMGGAGHSRGTENDFTYGSYDGLLSESESDNDDVTAIIAHWAGWESGAHNPPAVSWAASDSTGFSAAGFTLAIRPAS